MAVTQDYNYIGKSVPRVDSYEKATGKAMFVDDLKHQFKDLLHIRALRSPHAHAKLLKVDIRKAMALPGVVTIAVGTDPDIPWAYIPYASSYYGNPARDEVIWAGQAVALVCAESIEIAEDAIDLIEVEYEPLPFVTDNVEAMHKDSVPVIGPEIGIPVGYQGPQEEGPNILGSYKLKVGDVKAAFDEADVIVEGIYNNDKKSASQIEKNSAIVEYNHQDGGVTIYSNCCGAHGVVKTKICTMFPQLPESKVRVIQPFQGGSFGNRLFPTIEPMAVLMALRTKRNVSYVLSRKEMYTSSPSNWPAWTHIKVGAKNDGTIIAEEFKTVEHTGASMNNVYDGRLSGSGLVCVYDVPNVFLDGYAVATNTMPCAPYRGLGCPESEWAMENVIDILAEKLNMDPVELRLKNLIQVGEHNPYGEKLTSCSVASLLKIVADEIKFNEPCEQRPGPWRRGRGVAIGGKQNTPLGRSEAEVLVHSDGSIELLISVDEQGMGVQTTLQQMAATEFQIPFESIKITRNDTGRTPFDNFGASSRTTYTAGNAVLIACADAIEQLKEAAGRKVGVAARQVTIKHGKAYIVGSHIEEIPIADLFEPFSFFTDQNWGLQKGTPVRGRGVYCPAPAVPWSGPGHEDGRTPRMWNWYQYSATGVEVEVNVETGQIRILRIVGTADTGNPINPKLVEGQIDGGVIMAVGFAVLDGHMYDENGVLMNPNFVDYRVPTVLETPLSKDFKRAICPDPLPDGPYKAKGMAESITIPVGPAIAIALNRAVGIRPTVMPMTAERILKLIKEKEAGL
ncbi:MAG: xanthine dehydrogenase family protein molybdopterin-binding subunit [Planctomycetaceae bacterium]|nr:xanthine dehydrogenase family protein molybdopterin-binding subunit [Planctomycetaceae bacterium]